MNVTNLKIPLVFASLKLLLHLLTNTNYGFHRDELLYLSLGKNPAWGFWSNPPFIGLVSFINQNLLGDSLIATRLPAALFGSATLFLICLMAKDLGGKKLSQIIAGIAGFTSLAFLRSSHMFQPVVIDIFFWTLASWIIIRLIKTENKKWLYWLGITIGIGFLNKYSVAFLIIAIALSFLITPLRKLFLQKQLWIAAGISLLIVIPNLFWQWQNGFPVFHHMQALSESQLSNVNPFIFLLDQILMHFWGFLIWIPGLLFLLFNKEIKKYKCIGWIYIFTLFIFLLMKGKNYYTLGTYPMLIAAGGVFWDKYLKAEIWKWALVIFIFLGNLPLLPSGLPILSLDNSIKYFSYISNDLGIRSLTRWERGNIEALPQDYADMFGWEELGELTDRAISNIESHENYFIYGENYGHTGAVTRFSKELKNKKVASFSDTYRLWAPENISQEINTLIYINDELGEDVNNLFQEIEVIGEISHPYARERGTKVYLCKNPLSSFADFWRERVEYVRGLSN